MLVQASKMATLGEMATGIAHELNQPLNVIRLGCDYLSKRMRIEKVLPSEDLCDVTHELCANVERASRIINHLRQFGRKADHTMTSIDVNTPIRNVFTMLQTQFDTHAIGWKLELGNDLPPILGDENRLEQVFINLVINARDAILERAKRREDGDPQWERMVIISSFLESGRVVVTVADTGTGIAEQIRDRVFEPFFTTKKTGDGTGLGLSISYAIIKEHQGTIEIMPQKEPGITFRLTFPALTHGDG
jgi:C4-dicarboxylate-specific signal transduction histidine kinase